MKKLLELCLIMILPLACAFGPDYGKGRLRYLQFFRRAKIFSFCRCPSTASADELRITHNRFVLFAVVLVKVLALQVAKMLVMAGMRHFFFNHSILSFEPTMAPLKSFSVNLSTAVSMLPHAARRTAECLRGDFSCATPRAIEPTYKQRSPSMRVISTGGL